ncbi:MAG: YlmC/YmxH family sporulation protein [Oscillospiraceae bacterium]|nr:YlmC/YmxH family sporulation protein [Oscillospiraceae bacterium]
MDQRFTDLRCKEVININDGCRLGYVGDLDIRIPEGEITAIIVPGPLKFFGLFGRGEEYYIPWRCIKRIGDDVILIEHSFPRRDGPPPPKRGKKRW